MGAKSGRQTLSLDNFGDLKSNSKSDEQKNRT